jgi:hypothetical protein
MVSFAFALAGILTVSANSFWDPGILWHTESHRTVISFNTDILLATLFFMEFATAIILSVGYSVGLISLPADTARSRFLLTRPESRSAVFFIPFFLAVAGVLCIPGLVALFLLGSLALIHAPVLSHLLALARLVPSASHLGAHPGFLPLLAALHMGRRYLAGFSLGLCIVSVIHAQRWFIFSENFNIRRLAYVAGPLTYLLPAFSMWARPVAPVLLLPPGPRNLNAVPSALNITLHLAFAVILCLSAMRFVQKVEI